MFFLGNAPMGLLGGKTFSSKIDFTRAITSVFGYIRGSCKISLDRTASRWDSHLSLVNVIVSNIYHRPRRLKV